MAPKPVPTAARRDKRYHTGARPVAGAGYNMNLFIAIGKGDNVIIKDFKTDATLTVCVSQNRFSYLNVLNITKHLL